MPSKSFANEDCSGRFSGALAEFREATRRTLESGEVRFADVSSVMVAQSKFIEAISDVILSMLRSQQQLFIENKEVADRLEKLGSVFSSNSKGNSSLRSSSSDNLSGSTRATSFDEMDFGRLCRECAYARSQLREEIGKLIHLWYWSVLYYFCNSSSCD